MSSVLEFYSDRLERLQCERGFTEEGLVLRRGKTQDPYTISDHKNLVLPLGTKVVNGDLLTRIDHETPDQMIIVAKQIGADCVSMQGKRINTHIDIYNIVNELDKNHKRTGIREELVLGNVPSYCQDQSAYVTFYDAGFLPKVVKKFFVQPDDRIRDMQRIKSDDGIFQIDDIAKDKYRDVWVIQVSEDARKTV
ncbi:hypothetical protein [Anaerovibrio sp.]|uniref:hypothetical protein n=1 Tax=Anaerovibrio sp. TaxID=1872532 RepID=UPI003F18012C